MISTIMPCFQATDARSWRIITTVQQTTSSIKGYCCCCFFFKILPNITFTYLKDNESSRETGRSTEWYILLTGCSLWTEVHLWQNTVLPECLSSMTRLGYSHTHTHTHACMHVQRTLQTYTGCDRNARKSKQLDLSERNKKKLPVSVFVSAIGQPLQKLPHLYSWQTWCFAHLL